MLLKAHCDIKPTDTSETLHDRLAVLGGKALIDALEKFKAGTLVPEQQDERLTCYAAKLTKQEGEVNWATSAELIERQVRGLSPWPVAYTNSLAGVMKIHTAHIASVSDEASTPGDILVVSKEGIIVATGQGSLSLLRSSLQAANA